MTAEKKDTTPRPWTRASTQRGWAVMGCNPDRPYELPLVADVYKHGDTYLIEAAPEMLAALEELVQWCVVIDESSPIGLMSNARAAIAKARGKRNP